ncbi:DUF2306 domain-containing protein [Marinigracilibium pacificum]|uniref:DUF2306 domain-containing protein n=1 Tax=Marinigracilibium pacificum TaxID=2729599 RepID=A0A848J2B1_9BACT|nr:DUF2306 domain-containing protein [Marinigracilibium pacificum]NMM47322.1 DUF2306 domain-containing protein [Marinigracilibium pacificum]
MRLVKGFLYIPGILITLLILLKCIDYINPDFTSGFLSDKAEVFHYYKYAFYTHIIFATTAIILGYIQVLCPVTKIHRWLGTSYVSIVIFLAAPSGLFMAFFAIGGSISTINFISLSILWAFSTLKTYNSIKNTNKQNHKFWAICSFILANSAIFLRVLSFINNQLQIIPGKSGYVVISILSWSVPLCFYLIIYRLRVKLITN